MSGAQQYAYTPTSPSGITKALGDVFASLATEQQRYNRAANTNLIVAVSSATHLSAVEDIIDAFSLVHPSRFFVVYVDDSLESIATAISARCHGLSRSEHACSEVVRIGCPRAMLWLVPSVVRGNLMVGTATELYIADGGVSRELLDRLAPLADLVVYDSRDLVEQSEMVGAIARTSTNLLDLDWIELGPWREEIKAAFAKSAVNEHLAELREVVVTSGGTGRGKVPFSAFLLGGWIVHRLGLTHVMGRHGDVRAVYPAGGGRTVSLRFERASSGEEGIDTVIFRFGLPGGREGVVRLSRGKGLDTIVECGRSMRWSRPLERETREGLIRRYFLIGESTANYSASLRGALHLQQVE